VSRRTVVLLASVFALAVAVRLPGLGRGLWYDELFTVENFADTLPHALFAQRAANNHPLASVLAWLARRASEDPRVLRAPFVLLGALGVLATGWLASLRGGEKAAALAMALAAVHPAHVAFSQEVRGYAPLLLAAPLVVGLALEAKRPVLLAVAVALGLFSHLSLAVLVLALAALAGHERAWKTLAALAAGTLAALLLYAPMLSHLGAFFVRQAGHGGPDGLGRTLELLATADSRLAPAWLGAPFFALALAGGALRARRLACVAWAAALIIALAVSVAHPLFYARFALALLPLLLALAASGVATLLPDRRGLLLASPLLIVFGVATARRASWETEPIGPALRAYEGARFVFTGTGSELHASDAEPTHRIELFSKDPDAQFHGLYADVKVVPLAAPRAPAAK